MTALEQIDKLIESVRELINLPGRVNYITPKYRNFHDAMTSFVYENHLDKTEEWEKISCNLIYKSTQCMNTAEANIILLCLESVKRILLSKKHEQFWDYIHPRIITIAKDRFYNNEYADAIEASFKEINNRLKKIVKQISGNELDGADLMRQTFSPRTPILKIQDISTETGRNVQQGYMDIFAGAMTGIRNPKAHNNQIITREDAIRKLHLASLLMYKIDQALATMGIHEQ